MKGAQKPPQNIINNNVSSDAVPTMQYHQKRQNRPLNIH